MAKSRNRVLDVWRAATEAKSINTLEPPGARAGAPLSRERQAHLESGDVLYEHVARVLAELDEFREHVLYEADERLRAGVFCALRERIEDCVRLA